MGIFKKKVNEEEENWKKEIEKEAKSGARTEAAPILRKKIQQKEVDRLTGDKKSKLFEKLGNEFKPLGALASDEKMDRLLGHNTRSSGSNIDRMLGRDRPTVHIIEPKRRGSFREEVGYDDIQADERVERIMGEGRVVKEENLREAAKYSGDDFKARVKKMVKK